MMEGKNWYRGSAKAIELTVAKSAATFD